jgi:nitrogen regulatory protein PII-like uncharacterized protein
MSPIGKPGDQAMGWKVGKVMDITTGINGFSGPGFVLQQDGRSPSVTMVFHDDEAASEARTALESIVDKAAVIIGN